MSLPSLPAVLATMLVLGLLLVSAQSDVPQKEPMEWNSTTRIPSSSSPTNSHSPYKFDPEKLQRRPRLDQHEPVTSTSIQVIPDDETSSPSVEPVPTPLPPTDPEEVPHVDPDFLAAVRKYLNNTMMVFPPGSSDAPSTIVVLRNLQANATNASQPAYAPISS